MTVHGEFGTVIDAVLENGGGTYYLSLQRGGRLILGDAEFKGGYYVALAGRENVVPITGDVFAFDKLVVAEYIADNLNILRESDVYLGFWVNNNRVFLDVVKHIRDKDEAIRIGRENRQIAIFDIAAGDEILL